MQTSCADLAVLRQGLVIQHKAWLCSSKAAALIYIFPQALDKPDSREVLVAVATL